jgi:hypothetical protein
MRFLGAQISPKFKLFGSKRVVKCDPRGKFASSYCSHSSDCCAGLLHLNTYFVDTPATRLHMWARCYRIAPIDYLC